MVCGASPTPLGGIRRKVNLEGKRPEMRDLEIIKHKYRNIDNNKYVFSRKRKRYLIFSYINFINIFRNPAVIKYIPVLDRQMGHPIYMRVLS